MSKPIDLDLTEKEFKDATDKLEFLQSSLGKVYNEITLLTHLQQVLEQNISILKSRQIITIAIEYKKAKEDLDRVDNSLSMLRINRNNLEFSIEKARKVLADCRDKYIIALQYRVPKVIEVDFGRKND